MPSRAPKIEAAGGIEEDPVLFDALSFIPLFGLQPGSKWKQGNGRGLLPFIPLFLAAKTPEEEKARKTPPILATPAFRSECLLSETTFIGPYQVPPSVVDSEQLTPSVLFAGAAGLHATAADGATMASVSPPLALRVAFPADGLVAALIAVGARQPAPGKRTCACRGSPSLVVSRPGPVQRSSDRSSQHETPGPVTMDRANDAPPGPMDGNAAHSCHPAFFF